MKIVYISLPYYKNEKRNNEIVKMPYVHNENINEILKRPILFNYGITPIIWPNKTFRVGYLLLGVKPIHCKVV